ncbi:hypothetical protein [Bifidobacterium sp. AGR2158]|uniref:hypothetical protein n=1 Tax=Bifidobacterium sp. AGR2158 TaxID=1280675 RepID=UPI0004223DF5|nr:hypothetical protein [Bifidobacterium sp. AGR2158]
MRITGGTIAERIAAMCAAAAVVVTMGACGVKAHADKSYTFNVDTGDAIKVTLDVTDGYDITGKVPFEVTKDGEEIFEGSFLHEEGYELYREQIDGDDTAEILNEGERNGNDFIFWQEAVDDATEHNYVVKVKDSATVVLLEGNASEDAAKAAFDRMKIVVDD